MRNLAIVALACSLALSLTSCAASEENRLYDEITSKSGHEVSVASLFNVEADSYLVVCPYSTRESTDKALGFEWPSGPDYSASDSFQTVVFVADESVVAAVELRRDRLDFCGTEEGSVLAPLGGTLNFTLEDHRWVRN